MGQNPQKNFLQKNGTLNETINPIRLSVLLSFRFFQFIFTIIIITLVARALLRGGGGGEEEEEADMSSSFQHEERGKKNGGGDDRRFARFDVFPKFVDVDFYSRSFGGGVITIIAHVVAF